MISPLLIQLPHMPAAAEALAARPAPEGEPFAALLTMDMSPVEGAALPSEPPMRATVTEDTSEGMPVSPEALLALVAPLPVTRQVEVTPEQAGTQGPVLARPRAPSEHGDSPPALLPNTPFSRRPGAAPDHGPGAVADVADGAAALHDEPAAQRQQPMIGSEHAQQPGNIHARPAPEEVDASSRLPDLLPPDQVAQAVRAMQVPGDFESQSASSADRLPARHPSPAGVIGVVNPENDAQLAQPSPPAQLAGPLPPLPPLPAPLPMERDAKYPHGTEQQTASPTRMPTPLLPDGAPRLSLAPPLEPRQQPMETSTLTVSARALSLEPGSLMMPATPPQVPVQPFDLAPLVATGQPSTMAAQLAGQLAAALPRLRQAGGETLLTLEPARLGRVMLSWEPGAGTAPVLTVRAAEPATAALLANLNDQMTQWLRHDAAAANAVPAEIRVELARAERPLDQRSVDSRALDHQQGAATRDLATDAGQARQQASSDPGNWRAQVLRRPAVNDGDRGEGAALQPGRVDAGIRLA